MRAVWRNGCRVAAAVRREERRRKEADATVSKPFIDGEAKEWTPVEMRISPGAIESLHP